MLLTGIRQNLPISRTPPSFLRSLKRTPRLFGSRDPLLGYRFVVALPPHVYDVLLFALPCAVVFAINVSEVRCFAGLLINHIAPQIFCLGRGISLWRDSPEISPFRVTGRQTSFGLTNYHPLSRCSLSWYSLVWLAHRFFFVNAAAISTKAGGRVQGSTSWRAVPDPVLRALIPLGPPNEHGLFPARWVFPYLSHRIEYDLQSRLR